MYKIDKSDKDNIKIVATSTIGKKSYIGEWLVKNPKTPDNIIRNLGNGWFETKDLGRYCNHHINPNTRVEVIDNVAHLWSIKGIRKGDEITVDYTIAKQITGYASPLIS